MVAVPSTNAESAAAGPVRGEPGPAVITLLAGRPSRDGFRATLLDLAARGWFELRQPGVLIGRDAMELAGPVMCVLPTDADLATLLPYERRAAAHLVRHAGVGGEVAADAVMRDVRGSELRAFRDEVAADAHARGLTSFGRLASPGRLAKGGRLTRPGRPTEAGREFLGTWHERRAERGSGCDLASAAALGGAPLAPFAHRRGTRRALVVRWLRLPRWGEYGSRFKGKVLRQWEVDRGGAEGAVHYVAIDDGMRVRTFRIASQMFEMLTPGAVVHVHVNPRRKELLGVRPSDGCARAILPLCA